MYDFLLFCNYKNSIKWFPWLVVLGKPASMFSGYGHSYLNRVNSIPPKERGLLWVDDLTLWKPGNHSIGSIREEGNRREPARFTSSTQTLWEIWLLGSCYSFCAIFALRSLSHLWWEILKKRDEIILSDKYFHTVGLGVSWGGGFCWRLEFLSGGKPNPQWMVCFWDLHGQSFLFPSFRSSHGHTVGLHWRPYGPTVGLQSFHRPTVDLHWGKQYNKKRKVRPSAGWL